MGYWALRQERGVGTSCSDMDLRMEHMYDGKFVFELECTAR